MSVQQWAQGCINSSSVLAKAVGYDCFRKLQGMDVFVTLFQTYTVKQRKYYRLGDYFWNVWLRVYQRFIDTEVQLHNDLTSTKIIKKLAFLVYAKCVPEKKHKPSPFFFFFFLLSSIYVYHRKNSELKTVCMTCHSKPFFHCEEFSSSVNGKEKFLKICSFHKKSKTTGFLLFPFQMLG